MTVSTNFGDFTIGDTLKVVQTGLLGERREFQGILVSMRESLGEKYLFLQDETGKKSYEILITGGQIDYIENVTVAPPPPPPPPPPTPESLRSVPYYNRTR